MKFTFQLFSDLHQEFITNYYKIPPKADYLFLAGDIHNFSKINFKMFFDYVSENWKHVFYIPGNHEYYDRYESLHNLKKKYKHFFNNYSNIHFLDDETFTLNYNDISVKIIGSTLWSNITDIQGINDFKYINETPNLYISKEFFNNLHINSVNFLKNQIQSSNDNEKIIVITHFPPIQKNTSSPKYVNEKQHIKDYFSSNILLDFKNHSDKISCWIHGHTHFSNDFIEPETGIRIISNQLGYLQELKNTTMKEYGLFELEL
jgi:Icc-related predicted phosphoesterase